MKTKSDVRKKIFGTKNAGVCEQCGRPVKGVQFCSRGCFEDAGFSTEDNVLWFKGHKVTAGHANFFKD